MASGSVDFGRAIREFYKDHAMFAAVLEELQQQLSELTGPPPQARSSRTPLLQRVAAKAPSPRLAAYCAGQLPLRAPPANLAEQIDQNLRLLQILAAEMKGFVGQLQGQLAGNETNTVEEEPVVGGAQSPDALLLRLAALEGVQRELPLIEKIAAAVALDTPPDQLASYAAFLNCKPFLLESEVVGQLSDPGT